MNIINITLGVDTQPCSSITLGRRGENEVTQVVVDFSSWVEEFGAGVITLLAMRSQDTSAYPVVLTLDGNTATWDVTSTDTAYKGSGRAEYIYTVGNQIAKSVVFGTTVLQDIGEPSETPPDPYEEWLERLTELGAETQANAQAAEQSAANAAQSAEDAAESAASIEGDVQQAEEAARQAQSAQTASEAARDAAQTAQESAESSATAASGSAASAAGSAIAAAGSASDASSSASAASASATTASNAATQAEAAKTAAQAAQQAAEQAAQQAHVEYEQLSDAVDDLSDEVSQQKSAIEDLQALTNRKAGMLVDTASGSIASFVPDATIPDLLGVTVDIEPVQDLHGYDAPWPAGGGVNLFDVGDDSGWVRPSTGSLSISGNVISIKILGSGGTLYWRSQNLAGNQTVTMSCTQSKDQGRFFVRLRKLDDSGWMTSQDATISGLTYNQYYGGWYTDLGYGSSASKTVTLPECLYWNLGIGYNNVSVTVGDIETISAVQIEKGSTATAWVPFENICPISGWDSVDIMRSGADTTDPTTYTIQLGQTVYGGTLDVTNGTMLVDRTIIDCASITTWTIDARAKRIYKIMSELVPASGAGAVADGLICNRFKSISANQIYANVEGVAISTGSALQFRINGLTDNPDITLADVNSYFTANETKVVAKLATPVTIQLAPVTISTIANQTNNVWADAGDVDVTFAADLKTYIDQKIAAAVAALS